MREAFRCEKSSQPQFYKDLTKKTGLGSSFIIWDWHLVHNKSLKFYASVATGLKLKAWKLCVLFLMFVEIMGSYEK